MVNPFMENRVPGNVNRSKIITFDWNRSDGGISSWNNLLSQDNSATSLLRLLYSASTEDREIVTYFLDFHEKRVLLIDFLL